MEENITISREEYDALKADSLRLEMLLKAIFSHTKLSNYNDCGLNFNDIDDIMSILHPEECNYKVKELKVARGEKDV